MCSIQKKKKNKKKDVKDAKEQNASREGSRKRRKGINYERKNGNGSFIVI